MSDKNSSAGGGIGFFGAMFLIFLTLKLIGTINWSWWWVTAPLWGPITLIILIVVGYGVVYAIAETYKKSKEK